jgi:hypothetical protein
MSLQGPIEAKPSAAGLTAVRFSETAVAFEGKFGISRRLIRAVV